MREVMGGGAVEANRGATEALARRTGREDASSRGENMVGQEGTNASQLEQRLTTPVGSGPSPFSTQVDERQRTLVEPRCSAPMHALTQGSSWEHERGSFCR